jgi:hypothetical protein
MAARLLKRLLPWPRAQRRRRDEQRVGGNLRELERAVAELVVENRRLRAELDFYRGVVENDAERLYENLLAGLPPERRRYTANPTAGVALAIASAEGGIGDG